MKKLLFPLAVLSALAGCSSIQSYEAPKNISTARVRVAVETNGIALHPELHRGVLTELMDQKCKNRYQFPGFVEVEKRSRESLKSESSVIDLIKLIEGNSGEGSATWAHRVYEFDVEANKAHVFDFLYKEADGSVERFCGLNGVVTLASGDNVEVRYRVIKKPKEEVRCELKVFDLVQSAEKTIPIPRPVSSASCHPFIFR